MSDFPVFKGKHQFPPFITPQVMIKARRMERRMGRRSPPKTIIFCLHPEGARFLGIRYRLKRVRGFIGELSIIRNSISGCGVFTKFGIGAPAMALLTEETAALGAERFVILGTAGAIQPGLNAGDVILCERAIRDEGTSYHYLPPEKYSEPSKEFTSRLTSVLSNSGISFSRGTSWSTDAPYRETRYEIDNYQREGVQVVDMECAALFAVGQRLGLQTGALLIVEDNLSGLDWRMPSDQEKVHKKLRQLLHLLIGMV